eukprot:gnl/MRDRNA2_/MRDRNA2_153224_c0_seq1.p1 gnl/MRDRNA2_/MRDRNA2_153224_c0~~gnl/MRDRNA2_/MRDRNA2_153224_c0_seq1.p1  ORF type:complete len:337 (+),score=50.94 gnl/MRDRNA2_/MRDRNA2_153224_c0_seq1:142-1011(+)
MQPPDNNADAVTAHSLTPDPVTDLYFVNDEPYSVESDAGAFFVFTSNVDAHSFDAFEAAEVRECHGNTELWQCARPCSSTIWRAPLDFAFEVDMDEMLAPEGGLERASQAMGDCIEDRPGEEAPRVGRVRYANRTNMLRKWPPLVVDSNLNGFVTKNRPTCINCGGPARPAILMFGDYAWKDSKAQEKRYEKWCDAITDEIKERGTDGLRIVILEIGCGGNVTTVRNEAERLLASWKDEGAACTLCRVNPEIPLVDDADLQDSVVSLLGKGLDTLKRINSFRKSPATSV